MNDLMARLDFARLIAREAGAGTLDLFGVEGLEVELKADASPVTIADRRAERLLRDRISSTYPGDAILGEEYGEQAGTTGWRWILDPIDGTKSFVAGVPLFGTLIGAELDGQPVIGVIYLPALEECLFAARGAGAWREVRSQSAKPIAVSRRETLSDSLFCTSDVNGFGKRGKRDAFDALMNRARVSRTWGDCFGYALVATGRAEVMVDPAMSAWDAAAIAPIIIEAGGTFTDWQGRPTIHSGDGIATNGRILDEVLAIVRG